MGKNTNTDLDLVVTRDIAFEDLGEGPTRSTTLARYRTAADRPAHEKMGLTEGWGICTRQRAELAATP